MRTKKTSSSVIKADASWKIGIVYSSFYKGEVGSMVDGARKVLKEAGISSKNITEHAVAGSFEIPLIGSALSAEKKVDALIGLGIIVEGETHHAELIARETARGIMDVQVHFGIPFAFEVLYVKKFSQAKARSGGMQNTGEEAARVVLHSLAEIARLRS